MGYSDMPIWRYGIWDMGYGIWDMGYGIMGYGIWEMAFKFTLITSLIVKMFFKTLKRVAQFQRFHVILSKAKDQITALPSAWKAIVYSL